MGLCYNGSERIGQAGVKFLSDVITIGIAGGTGSGKTTITRKLMHEQFVEPSKRNADIIIPEGGQNRVAMDMVIERVQAHLNQSGKIKRNSRRK